MPKTPAVKIIPVILSGGQGMRLWPMSREDHPKQFCSMVDIEHSLMSETIRRVSDPEMFHPPIILGNHAHRFLIAGELKNCGFDAPEILIAPCVRNTAPAITAAALHVHRRYPGALMLVLPTDH